MSQKEYFQNKYGFNYSIEQTLFHGTSEDSVESIWRTGFNRSYTGVNGTSYGRGVYFARDASYSHHYTGYSRSGRQMYNVSSFRSMFATKVLVGQYCLGKIFVVVLITIF